MRVFRIAMVALLFASGGLAQETVTIPVGGGSQSVQADLYRTKTKGSDRRGIVLAHGGRFDKTSWRTQAQVLADAGYTVLAIAFRGDAHNPDGSPSSLGTTADNATDVLAAVTYLQRSGVRSVSAVGASLGGDAVGEADARADAGTIDRVVFLGSSGGAFPARLKGHKLFIVARNDRSASGLRLPEISEHYRAAPQPKRLVVLEGEAHAQYLFDTEQGAAVMQLILQFLSEP